MRASLPFVLIVSLFCVAETPLGHGAEVPKEPGKQRIQEWAAMLPEKPKGVGAILGDRKAWEAIDPAVAAKQIKKGEAMLSEPIPELTDELYLDFSKTGNRSRCQHVLGKHTGRLSTLVVAECLENRGRFLPGIEEAIRVLCNEKTWVMPAHDRSLTNFRETEITIDLRSSAVGWDLATTAYWLGDKLSPDTRTLIAKELERRIFTPYEKHVTTGKPVLWWTVCNNNWNAVCHAGVVGAALAAIDSRERRAFFAASMEDRISFFLNGITPDGYCSEGVGYWNYGFGHYILLADTIYQATAGKIDMMANKHVEQIANYARRIEILPGESPAFADCHPGARPDLSWMAYLSRRYGWGLKDIESAHLGLTASISSGIASLGILGFPNAVSPLPTADAQTPPALRDWFSDAGVLICRPGDGTSRRFAVALKGGHNAEHHNHNDVGSFVVAIDGKTPLLDPGSEVYTARTFSSHRYDSAVLNSFGHPVPRVAGQLQVPGREAAAKVLKADFTDDADTLVLDLASAYKVKELKKLVRTFVYSRQGNGKLTVTDEVEFDSPQQFGAALITYSPWKQLGAGHLTVGESPNAAQVALATTSGSLHIVAEELHEDMPDKRIPTRLGIDLVDPVKVAAVTLTIAPE